MVIHVSNDLMLFLSVMMSHRPTLPTALDQTTTLPKRGALCLGSQHRCGTVRHFQNILLSTWGLTRYCAMADLPLPIIIFSRVLRDTSGTLRPVLTLLLHMFDLMLLELRHIFNDLSFEQLL